MTMPIGQYADVNGLHLYYESHGAGRPLILLHGGLASGEMFAEYVELSRPSGGSTSAGSNQR